MRTWYMLIAGLLNPFPLKAARICRVSPTYLLVSEIGGGSQSGVAMGGVRWIQAVDCGKERQLADSIGIEWK